MLSNCLAFSHPLSVHNRSTLILHNISAKCFRKQLYAPKPTSKRHSGHLVRTYQLRASSEKLSDAQFDESLKKLDDDIRAYLSTCSPDVENPLDYITLKRANRIDLIRRIMEAGGSVSISNRLGISIKKPQSQQTLSFSTELPKFSSSASDQLQTSITLGQGLEERLSEIEEVIKQPSKSSNTTTKDNYASSLVPSPSEILQQNDTFVPPVVDNPIPLEERIYLTAPMRVGMLLLIMLTSAGFGRASTDLLPTDLRDICQIAAIGLTFAHVLLSAYVGIILAPNRRRNPLVWAVKALLSGPIGVQHLRALPVLEEEETYESASSI